MQALQGLANYQQDMGEASTASMSLESTQSRPFSLDVPFAVPLREGSKGKGSSQAHWTFTLSEDQGVLSVMTPSLSELSHAGDDNDKLDQIRSGVNKAKDDEKPGTDRRNGCQAIAASTGMALAVKLLVQEELQVQSKEEARQGKAAEGWIARGVTIEHIISAANTVLKEKKASTLSKLEPDYLKLQIELELNRQLEKSDSDTSHD